jgi:hypothetical protein
MKIKNAKIIIEPILQNPFLLIVTKISKNKSENKK